MRAYVCSLRVRVCMCCVCSHLEVSPSGPPGLSWYTSTFCPDSGAGKRSAVAPDRATLSAKNVTLPAP